MINKLMSIKTENRWLVFLFLFWGSVLVMVTPPGAAADEFSHTCRVLQLTDGVLWAPLKPMNNGVIEFNTPYAEPPKALQEIISAAIRKNEQGIHHWTVNELLDFLASGWDGSGQLQWIGNPGVYSPACYLPQLLGASVGRSLGLGAGMVFYLMRFCSLLFAAFFLYYSLAILPEKRLMIFFLSIMPMFLSECAAVTADAFLLPFCLFLVCWLARAGENKEVFSSGELLFLLAAAGLLGLIKSVYGTILLLYFGLPMEKVKKPVVFRLFGALLLGTALACSFGWNNLAVVSRGVSMSITPGSSAALQAAGLAAEPWKFAQLLGNTAAAYGRSFAMQFIGVPGCLQVQLPGWFYCVYAGLLALAAVYGRVRSSLRGIVLSWAGAAVSALALFLGEYLVWTRVGAGLIEGMQGRYFIPLFAMMALVVPGISCQRKEFWPAVFAAVLSGSVTVWSVVRYFYC